MSKYLTESKLDAIFKSFDMDNSGFITEDNLIDAFSKFNKELKKEEIQEIMKEHDFSKEGSISYKEFHDMMREEI